MNKWLKRILFFFGGLIGLILIVILLLQTRWAKNLLRDKLQNYISQKTKTEFRIQSIDYSLPNWVELKGVLMRDLNKDTLLFGEEMKVNIAMLKLISGKYKINKIAFNNVFINISNKENDSIYNYQFLIDAFKTKPKDEKDSQDTTALNFSLNQVALKQIRFYMLNYYAGSLLKVRVGEFNVKMDKLDLNKMHFDINKLYADNVQFNMQILKEDTTRVSTAKTSKFIFPSIKVDSLTIKTSSIVYENKPQQILTDDYIGLLQAIKINNTASVNQFTGKSFLLANSNILFQHAPRNTDSNNSLDTVKGNNNIAIIMDEIYLHDNNIVYNNILKPKTDIGLDYNHLRISNLLLIAKANSYKNGKIQSNIQQLSFSEQSGFRLDTLRGMLNVNADFIAIKNFILKTPNSSINAEMMVYPASFQALERSEKNFPNNIIIISNTIVGHKDLELLANGLTEEYKQQLDALGDIILNARIEGNGKQLLINQLNVNSSYPNVLEAQLAGILKNINEKNNIKYSLIIDHILVSKKVVSPFVNRTTQNINFPFTIAIKGMVAGTMQQLIVNLSANSSYGQATVKAKLTNFVTPQKMAYDIDLNAKNLETGKWIYRDSVLGKINGNIVAKGSGGFDVKNNIMKITTDIQYFRVQNNIINNIQLIAALNRGLIEAAGSIKDEILNISFNGNANIHNKYPTADAILNIAYADLWALGISKDTLNIKAFTKIKLLNTTPQYLNAYVAVDTAVITSGTQKIIIDSAIVKGLVKNDSTFITLTSPFADANIESTIYYNEMADLVQQVISRFMLTNNKKITANNKLVPKGIITADITVKPNNVYATLIKNFSLDNPIIIHASVTNNENDSALKVFMNVPGAQINTLRLGNFKGNVFGVNDSLHLIITADTIKQGNIQLYNASLKGGLSQNNFIIAVVTQDDKKKDQYRISFAGVPNNINGYDIKLNNDLMLNHQEWKVNPQNIFRTSKSGFNIQNFEIQNRQQRISAYNETSALTSPILILFDNFQLNTITSLLNKDSLQVDGLLNANLRLSDLKNTLPTMDGTIKLDSIVYQQMSVGNLNMQAKSSNGNVAASGSLTGNGNNVEITANYNANTIDAKVNLNPVAMASIQPFTKNNLVRSSGYIYGPINISGPVSNPVWNGELRFNNVQTIAAQFGTLLKIDNQKINFAYPTIQLNNFTLLDSLNNPIHINGTITKTKNDFISDLYITANDFHAIDNKAVNNNMLYGKAIVDIDANVSGSATAPNISGNVSIKNGTDITYVRQTTPVSAKERIGVIEFVDMDTISNLLTKQTYEEVAAVQNKRQQNSSLTYNLNIDVQPEAKFNVIVDPASGDQLQVQGQAHINAGVDPSGSIALTGTYDLTNGSYQFSYQFIKRKFLLLKGSTITLSGDPKKAYADITAAYEITTPPLDLLGNEIGGGTAAENSIYKRKVPFQVLLKIKGQVTAPELSFDIVLKEKAEGVSYEMANTIENKLQQLRTDPSQMNKQVFALLIMNRFIGEQSRDFFAGNGSGSGILANESVSNFLNGAINQIAADLVKGVDIDINLKNVDDDPNAQRTDLNVAVSKTFLDDRLSVSVGKSFTVEGDDPSAKGRNSSNNNVQFIPDVNTSYKLSKDGRYMMRAYRRNQYEAIMDGYFIETGVAFSFTMDYNKFKELLKKKKR